MTKEAGCFKVWTDESGRKILFSRGRGIARAHEVEWLYETVKELSEEWQADGFAYVAFIEELQQVSPKGSGEYIKLHEILDSINCQYIVYIEGNSYEVSVQAARHKQMSNTTKTQNKYFITVDEGLEFLATNGF